MLSERHLYRLYIQTFIPVGLCHLKIDFLIGLRIFVDFTNCNK